jgi:pimeloyl-ACP methyl ester carboxylesterase
MTTDTPWVLIRGLTREAGHWGTFVDELRQCLPEGARVLTPDLAGNGVRFREASHLSVPAMAEDLRQQLREQGLQGPCRVLAMSLGAMVATAWAHAHPAEIDRMVLMNTSLKPYSQPWERLRPAQWLRIVRMSMMYPDVRAIERTTMRMTTRHPAHPDSTLEHWMNLRTAHPVTATNALRQLWAALRYSAPGVRPPVPVLLLQGLGDELVSPRCTQALQSRWQCAHAAHPTAGHDLPLDASGWVVEQVMNWVMRPQGQTPASHPSAHSEAGPRRRTS